jgi:MFS family permease
MLTDSVNPESYGHAFGFHRMMDTLGAIIGPSIAFFLLPLIGFRNIFLIAFIPGLLAILVFALFTREKISKQRTHEHRKLTTDIRQLPKSFKPFLFAVGIFGMANFANTFLVLKASEGLNPSLGVIAASGISALLYVLLNVGAAIFAYVFGALGDKFSKRDLLALGYLIFSAYCVGFVMLPPNIINYALLFMLAGVETGAIDAGERSYAADLLGEDNRGTGFGVLSTVNGVGDFVSSVTAGLLWTLVFPNAAFAYGAVLATIAAGALALSRRLKTAKKRI